MEEPFPSAIHAYDHALTEREWRTESPVASAGASKARGHNGQGDRRRLVPLENAWPVSVYRTDNKARVVIDPLQPGNRLNKRLLGERGGGRDSNPREASDL